MDWNRKPEGGQNRKINTRIAENVKVYQKL